MIKIALVEEDAMTSGYGISMEELTMNDGDDKSKQMLTNIFSRLAIATGKCRTRIVLEVCDEP